MSITGFVKNGVSLVSHYFKMIFVIYALNISVALLLAVPLFFNLSDEIGKQGVRDQLGTGFQYDWWSAFRPDANDLENTIRPALGGGFAPLFDNLELLVTGHFGTFGIWIFVFGFAYLCLSAFLNGGIIGLFAEEKRNFSVGRFFSFSGFYFHHFFAIAMTSVLLYFILYKFLGVWILGLFHSIAASLANDHLAWGVHLVGYFIILAIVLFFNIVLDYTKIIIVLEKKDSAWASLWEALKFLAKHLFPAFGLYALLALIGAGLVLVGGMLFNLLNRNQVILVVLLVTMQQLFIIFKIGLRLTFYGSQLLFYQQSHSQQRKLKKL